MDRAADSQEAGKVGQQGGYTIRLEDFEGPLDLLLFLIKKNEVNIYDIPVSLITEQYLEFIRFNARVDLENVTDFHVMAATLLYIKSRMLLPVEVNLNDELEDPRKDLVERLIEYQKYRKLAELMAGREEETEWYIERRKTQPVLPFTQEESVWEELQVWDLLQTFSHIMKNLSPERIISLYEEVSVNEKISLINELLEARGWLMFTDLVQRSDSLMEVICAFLAILESVKVRRIRILQNRLFGDIRIEAALAHDVSCESGNGDGG